MTQSLPLFTSQVKDQPTIRADILRTISNHLRSLGIPNPNVGPNSDYYGIADGVANEICVGLANGVVATNDLMPDTAGGANLDRWLAIFGLARAGATQSSGVVLPTYSLVTGYTLIPLGAQLLDASGLRYEVLAGGSYGPGNPGGGFPANLYVPVQSVDAGASTDHANGDTLTWVSSVPFVQNTVTVGTQGGTDGLSGGNDSEATQDEPPRQRLLSRIQNPPGGGNWPDVAEWARESSPDVQDSGVYPALLGPATVFFVAWRAPQTAGVLSSTSKNRSLPAALVTGSVVPYVQGKYSARAAVIGASVVDYPVDVALLLSLPAAPTAQPAGPGGGWLDGDPWPHAVVSGGLKVPCTVQPASVTSTSFTLNAQTPPTKGVSRVAYISPTNWQLYTATVTNFTGTSGAYVVTIDTPWPNIAADFAAPGNVAVFPQSTQQANYFAAALAAFGNMGPGEWTASPIILVRSFRHPSAGQKWYASLDANFLRTIENAGPEVLSAQWMWNSVVGSLSGGGPPTPPPVPATPTITTTEPLTLTSAAPNCFTPRSISWYAQ